MQTICFTAPYAITMGIAEKRCSHINSFRNLDNAYWSDSRCQQSALLTASKFFDVFSLKENLLEENFSSNKSRSIKLACWALGKALFDKCENKAHTSRRLVLVEEIETASYFTDISQASLCRLNVDSACKDDRYNLRLNRTKLISRRAK